MNVKTLTGAQIYRLLEQQCDNQGTGRTGAAGVARASRTPGPPPARRLAASTPGTITINGVPSIRPARYRVTMNNFLADGGDGFTGLQEGTDQLGGEVDLDAAVNYFLKNSPVAPGPRDRVTRLG